MKKLIITHTNTTDPDPSKNQAAGYGLYQTWLNTTTGVEWLHKTDGVWVEKGGAPLVQTIASGDTTHPPSANAVYNRFAEVFNYSKGIKTWTGITYDVALDTGSVNSITVEGGTYFDQNGEVKTFNNAVLEATINVNWSSFITGNIVASLVYVDSTTGYVLTAPAPFSAWDRRTKYTLAVLFSEDGGTTIKRYSYTPYNGDSAVNYERDKSEYLKLKKGLGLSVKNDTSFGLKAGYIWNPSARLHLFSVSDTVSPHWEEFTQQVTTTFGVYNQLGAETAHDQTLLNAVVGSGAISDYYDAGGTPTLLSPNKFQILRVYVFGNTTNDSTTPLVAIQRGQAEYNSIPQALDVIRKGDPNYVTNPFTALMWMIGYIVVERGFTATNDDTKCILQNTNQWCEGTGSASASIADTMLKSVYDPNGDGVVVDSDKLGGQLPAYYQPASTAVTLTGTQVLTNKTIVPRTTTVTYASLTTGNLTPNLDTTDILYVTGVTGTLNILNPSGTKYEGKTLQIFVKDNLSPQTITTGTDYVATELAVLPTTTLGSTNNKVILFRYSTAYGLKLGCEL